MAAPTYSNNNTVLAIADLALESWDESSDAGWDDEGSMVDDSNLYLQGDSCVSAQFTKDGVGTIIYSHGSAITVPTDGAVLMWHLWAAPPALATKALGGVRVLVGNSYGDFYAWKISGSDEAPAPLGGWANYAIDPSLSVDYTVGTPDDTWSYFGTAVSATAQARGNPNAMDSISYGRCEQEYTNGDEGNGYAVFSGYASVDNNASNRYALLQEIEGGYKMQGLASFGTSGTLVDFRDENTSIVLANTEKVSANFHKFEVNNASSRVDWTAISISALGTIAKGRFEAIDNATINKTSCTFTDMDSFIYQSNSTILTSVYRRCGLITQGSATLTSCTFDSPSGAICISSDDIGTITKCTFTSDGSNHAIDRGNVTIDTSEDWDNVLVDYAAANGSTGNEAIKVNVSTDKTYTISVQTGATSPKYYNTGAGTVVIVENQVSVEITNVVVNSLVYVATVDGNGDDSTVLINEIATTSTVNTSVTYGDLDYTDVTIVVRYASGSPKYYPIREAGIISSLGMAYTANQRINTIAN